MKRFENYKSTPADDIPTAADYLTDREFAELDDNEPPENLCEKRRLKLPMSPPPSSIAVSNSVLEALTRDEISEIVQRHWEGDAGENPSMDQGRLVLESLFTVRSARIVVVTDYYREHTSVLLQSDWIF